MDSASVSDILPEMNAGKDTFTHLLRYPHSAVTTDLNGVLARERARSAENRRTPVVDAFTRVQDLAVYNASARNVTQTPPRGQAEHLVRTFDRSVAGNAQYRYTAPYVRSGYSCDNVIHVNTTVH